LAFEFVAAFHHAGFGFEDDAAGVGIAGAGRQMRLFTNDPKTLNFLKLIARIANTPVATDQLRSLLALVADGDGVGEHKAPLGRLRLGSDIAGLYSYLDGLRHGVSVNRQNGS